MRTRRVPIARNLVVVIVSCTALVTAGCSGSGDGSSARPTSGSPRASTTAPALQPGALADLDMYLERLESIHPDPFHGIDRDDFVAALDDLKMKLPTLTPDQSVVEVSRLVALLSRAGRDGHQFAMVLRPAPMLPMRVYEFAEGLTITAAQAPYGDLVGRQITAINGHPIADVLAAIEPLVPRDGPSTVPDFRPAFFVRTDILAGLGLVQPGPVDVTVADGTSTRTVAVAPVSASAYTGWAGDLGAIQLPERSKTLYLRDNDTVLWSTMLAGSSSAYFRLTQVRTPTSDSLSTAQGLAADPDAKRLILDIRQNPGGDNNNNDLILGLLTTFRNTHPAAPIVVLTDRGTFSAAANLSTDAEQAFHPVYVGEAAGGGLNFWNDVTQVRLDNLPVPMQIAVSTRYWQRSTPDDPRLTIDPDVAVPVTAADYFADRDPALAAAEQVTG